jgi:hypothetical protein
MLSPALDMKRLGLVEIERWIRNGVGLRLRCKGVEEVGGRERMYSMES